MASTMVLISVDELVQLINGTVTSAVNTAMAGINNDQGHAEETLINQKELAKKLGVSEQTIIRWKAKKKIPFKQVGTAPRFNLSEVLKAIEKK